MRQLSLAICLLAGTGVAAHAGVQNYNFWSNGIALAAPVTLTFVYEGRLTSGPETTQHDVMSIQYTANGVGAYNTVFDTTTAKVGDTFTTPLLSVGTYDMKLTDLTIPATWSSVAYGVNTGLNGFSSDVTSTSLYAPHLFVTQTYSVLGLTSLPAAGVDYGGGTWLYGWEDSKIVGTGTSFGTVSLVNEGPVFGEQYNVQPNSSTTTIDYNDLMFTVEFNAPIAPAPEPLSLSILASAMVGLGIVRRRRAPNQTGLLLPTVAVRSDRCGGFLNPGVE